MKKTILAICLLALTPAAFADQCQGLQQKEAERAVMLLQNGATFIDYCQPCGDVPGQPQIVKSLEMGSFELGPNEVYTTVKINGTQKDMAYTYVKVAPKTFVNIAKVINCSTLDETSVSTFVKK